MPRKRRHDRARLVIVSQKKHRCDHPKCDRAFVRSHDLNRHKKIHCRYDDREFGCPSCKFRSNQKGGLLCHVNSVHENLRLACDEPGCGKTFSDPSSRSKHRQKIHPASVGRAYERVQPRQRKAPYRVPIHARVARHVEEHSRQDVLNQFATFALEASTSNASTPSSNASFAENYHDTGPSTLHGSSSVRPSSTYGPNYSSQSPCEPPGVLHRATDVPTDCWSIDTNNKHKHQQAYNANHPAGTPTAWGYSCYGPPYLSAPQPPFSHPSSTQHSGMVPGDLDVSQTCRCWRCVVSPHTLIPRGPHQDWMQAQSEPLPFKFSYLGGHVPERQWSLPPYDGSSAYPRRMFVEAPDNTPGRYFNR